MLLNRLVDNIDFDNERNELRIGMIWAECRYDIESLGSLDKLVSLYIG